MKKMQLSSLSHNGNRKTIRETELDETVVSDFCIAPTYPGSVL